MNLGQIRNKARRKLDELNASFWSDTELNDYINQGYFQLWQKMIDASYRLVEKVALLNLVANTREVATPSDFSKVRILEHLVGDVWFPCKYYERYDTLVSTSATADVGDQYRFAYSLLGTNLILEPAPQNNETATLRLTYFYQPSELTSDTETPNLEVVYHDILVQYCCVQAKEKEEMTGGGGTDVAGFRRTYAEMLAQFENNIGQESQQRQYAEPYILY